MRMTRAALRAQAHEDPQAIFEDMDADSFHTDANQDLDRPPLKDISTETNPAINNDPFIDEEMAPAKKAKGKKGAKKVEEQVEQLVSIEQEAQPEETCDINHTPSFDESIGSYTLSAGESFEGEQHHEQSSVQEISVIDEEQLQQPLDSVSTPEQSDLVAPKTPKFNPSIHKPLEATATPNADTVEDSFVEKITSRTPGRVLSFQEDRKSPELFREQISSRTTRIEDSVEAIDALEDALERVTDTIPALDELKIESPIKSRKDTPARAPLPKTSPPSRTPKKPVPTPSRNQRVSPDKTRPTPKSVTRPQATAPRQSSVKPAVRVAPTLKPIKRINLESQAPRLSSVPTSTAPPLSFSNSPAKSLPNTTKKRIPSENLSTSKPAFIPAKSTKPPTKPAFQLPSEAISAKAKALREERLKREEEAEKERKAFKARPVPAKVACPSVAPRVNKASQARMSIYANGLNKENVAPKPTIAPLRTRPSSLESKSKASDSTTTTRANSSVRRTTSTTAVISKTRVSSINLTTGQKSAVTKDEAVKQQVKGKEVFGRTKAQVELAEKERKEKELATKKARTEAAERGRQASREWAEKQKKKIVAQAKDKILVANVTVVTES